MLGGGEDADVDDDGVIVPSRRWSGHGPGEAGVVCLESIFRLAIDELEGTG